MKNRVTSHRYSPDLQCVDRLKDFLTHRRCRAVGKIYALSGREIKVAMKNK